MPHCGRSLSQQLRLCVFLLHQCALSSDQVRRMASKCRRQQGLFLEHNGFASGGWTRQELTTASFHSPSDPSPESPQRQSTISSTNLHCSLLHRACSVFFRSQVPSLHARSLTHTSSGWLCFPRHLSLSNSSFVFSTCNVLCNASIFERALQDPRRRVAFN